MTELEEFVKGKFDETVEQSKENLLEGLRYLKKLRNSGSNFTNEQTKILKDFNKFIDNRLEKIIKKNEI